MILPPPGRKPSPTSQRRRRPRPVLTLFGPDPLSQHYASRLDGVYDCVDRLTINAYFPIAQTPGGFRTWWRDLFDSDDNLDNTHLMRLAGRFSRHVRGWAKKHGIPVIDCRAGERKHEKGGQLFHRLGQCRRPEPGRRYLAPIRRDRAPGAGPAALARPVSLSGFGCGRTEEDALPVRVLDLSGRVQPEPPVPGWSGSGNRLSGSDRSHPSSVGSQDGYYDLRLQASPQYPGTDQARTSFASRDR